MNNWSGIGRLTKAPELRYTSGNQTAICRFKVAIDRIRKVEGKSEADFIPVVVIGKAAENANKYLDKGRLVGVTGSIQTRSWKDDGGTMHYVTEIIANEVKYLDKAKDSESGGNGSAPPSEDWTPVDDNDDLPF